MLGVLLGLILVEQRNDLAHHRLHRIVLIANGLGDGDQLDAVLGELAKIEFLLKGVAEEAAVAVHDDNIERVLAVAGALDHLLESRAFIIGGRTALDELGNNLLFLCAAPRRN